MNERVNADNHLFNKFAVDIMLGRLAKWLRLMGWDTLCLPIRTEAQLYRYIKEGRRILTRQRKWCKIPEVVCFESNNIDGQIREFASKVGITLSTVSKDFLTRCVQCNEIIVESSREEALGKVPEYVWNNCRRFYTCPKCKKIYWSGTHVVRMQNHLNQWMNKQGV